MNRTASGLAAIVLVGIFATSVAASDFSVRCVQNELNYLELDAGSADGVMGARTLAAAAAYLERPNAIAGLPTLTRSSAQQWCSTLASTHPDTASVVFIGDWTTIEFGPGVSADYREHIQEALKLSIDFFAERLGLQTSYPVFIYASTDLDWLSNRNIEATGARWSAGHQASIAKRYETVTAEAGTGWMIVNTGLSNYSMSYPASGGVRAQRIQLIAHELFHTQQYALTGDRAANYVSDPIGTTTMGPNWLIEGAAEYVGYSLAEKLEFMTIAARYAPDLQRARNWESNGAFPLSEYETKQQAGRPFFWDVGRVGVQALVARTGIESLPIFWREMGTGADWKDAFKTAFAVDVGAFYDEFNIELKEGGDGRPSADTQADSLPDNDTSTSTASPQKARAWFNRATALDGNGVEADKEAARFYLLAASARHAGAARNLAGMYGSGRGVVENQQEAAKWFRVAAEAGDAQGQYALATWYLSNSVADEQERISWLREAAAQGHREAIASLNQLGVPLVNSDAEQEPGTIEEVAGSPDQTAALFPSVRIDPQVVPRNGAECVQIQLNALGFDAGTPDGLIGSRTRSASVTYLEHLRSAWTDEPVSNETSLKWCLMIADEHPELIRLWWDVKPDTVDQAIFSDLSHEFDYAIRESDRRLTRSELEDAILDHRLVFDWGKPKKTTLIYRRSGQLLIDDQVAEEFDISDDGEICVLVNGKKDDCRLYLMHHGMLLQTNRLGERWVPEVLAVD